MSVPVAVLTRWRIAGAVSLLIDIVRDGGSAVQSAVVALEKLCSQASGTLLGYLAKAHQAMCLCLRAAH